MLYKDILFKWLEEKQLEVRTSTFTNYLKSVNQWLIPAFGECDVRSISKNDLQKFILQFSESHKRNTVINLTKPLSASFKWAKENGFIECNVWENIKIPKDFSEKEIDAFTREEVEKLLNAKGYQKIKKDMILLGYRTGMRLGEVLALKWEDINFTESFLMIRRTLSGYKNNHPEITEPKTRKSKRRIDIDKTTLEMLRVRNILNSEGYVFGKSDGSIYSRQAINIPRMCKSVGIKPRSFHALRHTHATILLAAGVHPKIVQERLGHSEISTTLDTYSHMVAGMQQAAVNVFNQI